MIKNKLVLILVITTLISFGIFVFVYNQMHTKVVKVNMKIKYIIAETGMPDSFDPINSDKTQNISVMRMLYSAPVEIDSNNILTSRLLSEFRYSESKRQIYFKVREGNLFSNGEIISAKDVCISIARFAYFHPTFPVIKNILGIKAWADRRNGINDLPIGISIHKNEIVISFDKNVSNPLFRFCLEVFSVIPEKCIDKNDGRLICDIPPFSGYFELYEKLNSQITFHKRKNIGFFADEIKYNVIVYEYKSIDRICDEKIDSEFEFISMNEVDLYSSNCKSIISQYSLHFLPASRFGILRFNDRTGVFTSNIKRNIFAAEVRHVLSKDIPELHVTKGLFPKILTGYLDDSHIIENIKGESLDGIHITLPIVKTGGLSKIYNAIILAAKNLGMIVKTVDAELGEDLVTKFISGKFSVIAGSSGFWAQDPVGDLSMWMTPGLHKTMTFVWNDKLIYSLINKLEESTDLLKQKELLEQFNKYIAEESSIKPIAHFRRVFVSKKNVSGLNLQQAISAPAAWQIVPEFGD